MQGSSNVYIFNLHYQLYIIFSMCPAIYLLLDKAEISYSANYSLYETLSA